MPQEKCGRQPLAGQVPRPLPVCKPNLERSPLTCQGTALDYLRRGWAPVLYPRRSKAPKERGWPTRTYTEEELSAWGGNVGVILGARSVGLIDLDLDCPEALTLAGSFLPLTEATFGRASKRCSHFLYTCAAAPAYSKFSDIDGSTLLEVRGDGHQTMFPGSVHPCGELVEWDRDGEPKHVDTAHLVKAAGELAAACLLVRHWPKQGRQDVALALAGGLLRGGRDEEWTAWFISLVARVAGDEEAGRRGEVAGHTGPKVEAGGRVLGWPSLAKLLGSEVVDRVRLWLGVRHEADATHVPGCKCVSCLAAAEAAKEPLERLSDDLGLPVQSVVRRGARGQIGAEYEISLALPGGSITVPLGRASDLLSFRLVRAAVFDATGRVLAGSLRKKWPTLVELIGAAGEAIETPCDTAAETAEWVRAFMAKRSRCTSLASASDGSLVFEDGTGSLYIQDRELLMFARVRWCAPVTRRDLALRLSRLGLVHVAQLSQRAGDRVVKARGWWRLPAGWED